MKPILVTSTTPSKEEAETLSAYLVGERLAACVNIFGPISSFFWWEGKVQKEEEYKLFIKSTSDLWEKLLGAIREKHSYSVPEVTRIDIDEMNPDYRKWLADYLQNI